MLKIVGWLMLAIAVIAMDYNTCKFLNILWAFWLQFFGFALYFISFFLEKD